jgi:hypothetical protein
MAQKIRKKRITKREWYDRGGAWCYYVNLDQEGEIRWL